MPIEPGTRLGPYEVIAPLGAGGMGEVYQAHDDRLNRTVALKVLSAARVANADRRRRFVQEAQLASSLHHPSIVTIFDIGSTGDGDYLAMEFVKGRTLDALIPRNGLRLQEALRYGIQIADALAAAHAAGIVHRDLKPGNIMVTDQGQIKILDFGLATLTEAVPTAADETRAHASVVDTGVGTIVGTVAYMSPEQAEGRSVDARSDLFSFGAILYEMLSGQRAFRADTAPGTLAAVINLEPPPLATVAADLPQEVDRLVTRCLRKDVTRRAQHASDIKLALEELHEDSTSGSLQGAPTAATPSRWRGLRLALVAGGVVLVVAAIALAVTIWSPAPAPPAQSAVVPIPLTSLPGYEMMPTFSPDATQVAFVWRREGILRPDVYVQMIGGAGAPVRLTDDGSAHMFPAWSPDGKHIALWHAPIGMPSAVTDLRLVLVAPLGGAERTVLEWVGPAQRISWSPDSRWFATSQVGVRLNREKGITLLSPLTGERIEWAAIDDRYAGSVEPAFSPDGRRIAFIQERGDILSDVYVASVGTDGRPSGPPTLLATAGKVAKMPVWAADGKHLLLLDGSPTSNGGVVRVRVDGSGAAERIRGLEHAQALALAVDGRRLAISRGGVDADIWRLDLQDEAASGRVAHSTLSENGAEYSPDGSRIAFSSNRSGASEIWVADSTGENALALTQFGGPVPGTARWSPDGSRIAFDGRPAGNADIFVVPSAGGAVRQLTTDSGEDARPAWSYDGRWIYFSSDRSGRAEIWRMSADGRDPIQVTKDGGLLAVASPDGQWLYYVGLTAPSGIRRMHPDGSGDGLVVTERAIVFRPTDKGLWFVTPPLPEKPAAVRVLRFADNTIRDVAQLDFLPSPSLSVSHDERYVLLGRLDSRGTDLLLVNDFR